MKKARTRTFQKGGKIILFKKILPSKTYTQVIRTRVSTRGILSSEPACMGEVLGMKDKWKEKRETFHQREGEFV